MADNVEVGDLVARISFDDTGLNKSMAEINRQMKLVESEFGKASTALKGYGSTEEQLKAKTETLNQQMQLQQQKINKLNEAFQASAATKGMDAAETQKLANELNKTQTVYNKLESELDGVNRELEEQRKKAEEAANPWKKLGDELEVAGNKMKEIGDKMTSVGKSMSMKVTAPIVAFGTLAAKASVDFESAFAGVRKTVDATEEEFAELESGIRNMSKEMPAAATEIAAVAEAAGQLGIAKENILDFTEVMIGLGEATNMTADEAATQFARLANITQMPQENFDKLGSSVVALGNSMATTEGEIVAMSLRLAAQGAQIGMTEAQIMALAGTMSSLGIEAEAGGTAMTTILKKIQNAVGEGEKSLEGFANAAKMTTTDFAAAFKSDPVTALDAFVKGLSQSSSEGENLNTILGNLGISGIREADTLLRMAGNADLLSAAVETSTQAWEENTALTNEVAQRYGTTASQLAIFKNQVTDLAIQIGDILIPIIMDVVAAVQPWIEKFAAMDESTQKVIIAVAGVTAAIGPLLIFIGNLVSAYGTITVATAKLLPAFAAGGAASKALGAAFTALTGPVGIAVAAIAAIGTVVYLVIKHWESIKTFFVNLFNWFNDLVGGWGAEVLVGIMPLLGVPLVIIKHWDKIKEGFSAIWNWTKDFFSKWGVEILAIVVPFIGIPLLIVKHWDAIKQGLANATKGASQTVIDGINIAIAWVTGLPSRMQQMGKDIIQGLVLGIASMIVKVQDKVKEVANVITFGLAKKLDINSPSRVTMEMGEFTGEGFAIGLKNSLAGVAQQAAAMSKAALPQMASNNLRVSQAAVPESIAGPSQEFTVVNHVYLDGKEISRNVSRHQGNDILTHSRGLGFA